jgi:hypothetical protein
MVDAALAKARKTLSTSQLRGHIVLTGNGAPFLVQLPASAARDSYDWSFSRDRFTYSSPSLGSSWDGAVGRVRWSPQQHGMDGCLTNELAAMGARSDPVTIGYKFPWNSDPGGQFHLKWIAEILRADRPVSMKSTPEGWRLEWRKALNHLVLVLDPARGFMVVDSKSWSDPPTHMDSDALPGVRAVRHLRVLSAKFVDGSWLPDRAHVDFDLAGSHRRLAAEFQADGLSKSGHELGFLFKPGDVVGRDGAAFSVVADDLLTPVHSASGAASEADSEDMRAYLGWAVGVGVAVAILASLWRLIQVRRS